MITNKNSVHTLAIITTLFIVINLFTTQSAFLGVVSFAVYIVALGYQVGNIIPNIYKNEGKLFWGILLMMSYFIISNVIFYYAYQINEITSCIVLLLPLFIFFIRKKNNSDISELPLQFSQSQVLHVTIFLILEIILLAILITHRTTDVLPTPWLVIAPFFFILYATASGILIWITYSSKQYTKSLVLISLHIFITYAVVAIIYTFGYGFDGFIHRATEQWIFDNGFITPKQPFYIGQYGLIVWLAHITKIPLHYLDIYFVPVAGAITLPFVVYYAMNKAFGITKGLALNLTWILPFIYFASLHLTTPHNVVLLLTMLTIFTSLASGYDKLSWIIPIALSICSVVTHPLIGVPLFIFVSVAFIAEKVKLKKWLILPFVTGSIALLPVAMFVVYLLLNGHAFPDIVNPLNHLDRFLELFERPYWYREHSPFIFELLYVWQWLIAPIVIVLGVIGFALRKQKQMIEHILFATTIGLWLGALLLRTWIVFPDVIELEQTGYPLRLLTAGLLFLVPLSMFGLYTIGNYIYNKLSQKKMVTFVFIFFAAIVLMISLYLAYPGRNPKVWFPGFNVTSHDFEAVEWIHNQHEHYDYVVLANSLTSVAALTNYSFAQYFDTPNGELFYYPIPTGGPLYSLYLKMLYEGQKKEYMLRTMDLVNVNTAYFVINSYWDNFDAIISSAKQTADSWQIVNNGKIYIFKYTR